MGSGSFPPRLSKMILVEQAINAALRRLLQPCVGRMFPFHARLLTGRSIRAFVARASRLVSSTSPKRPVRQLPLWNHGLRR